MIQNADSMYIIAPFHRKQNYDYIRVKEGIPKNLTKVRKYFDRIYPNTKGFPINLGVIITFNINCESFKSNVRYKM